jgi:hypothetical protein
MRKSIVVVFHSGDIRTAILFGQRVRETAERVG